MKANWGGANLHLGEHVYINAGLTLVDDTHIYIGDYTMLGPNVMIATAGHPILPPLRKETCMQYNLPVHIGSTCWIGASDSILPGRQHWRWQRHRGGECGHPWHPPRGGGRREPLPGAAPHH